MFRTLIRPDQLQECIDHPSWRVVDCRFDLADPEAGEKAWRESHVPGAVYAHLERDLSGPVTPESGRHPLPESAALVATFGRLGIDGDTQIVAYDASGGAMAARLWWLARWMGHERVAVLDGGWPAWLADELPTTSDRTRVAPAHFPRRAPLAEPVTAAAIQRDSRVRPIDARAPERFRGDVEPIDPVAGHIPGAINLPFKENLDETGRFLSVPALQRRFAESIAVAPDEIVHYCGSGVTACHNMLAMEHAGLPGSRLYAGSWSEWIRDSRRPVARGK